MMNAKCSYLMMVSLVAIGCGLENQAKNKCAVQADCLDGYVCNPSGTCELEAEMPDAPTCVPNTCAVNQCGTIDDGCSDTIECGCTSPAVCEGRGVPNQCGVPVMCTGETDAVLCTNAALLQCGSADVIDTCGDQRSLSCGTCSAGTCGAQSHGLCDELLCTASGWCRALGGTLAGDLAVRDLWSNGQGEVFALAASNVTGKVLRFDGTRWKTHATGPYPVRGGAGTGTGLWFATSGGDILTANGSSLVVNSTVAYTWTSMHAVSPTDVYVVGQWGSGSGAAARARHFDGDVWTNLSFGGTFDLGWHLLGVSAAASNSVWAVGAAVGNGTMADLPTPLVISYNGIAWTVDRTLPTSRYLRGVWAAAPNNVWAVGDSGTILHFDGTDWSASPSGVTQHLYAITGSGDTVWAAGFGGTILKKVGSGSWTVEQSGTSRTINALWATSAGDVWAGGDQGLLLRYRP